MWDSHFLDPKQSRIFICCGKIGDESAILRHAEKSCSAVGLMISLTDALGCEAEAKVDVEGCRT